MTTQLESQQLYDLLNGATILGSGGGGPYSQGQDMVKYILQKAPQGVTMYDPAKIAPGVDMAVTIFIGSPDAALGLQDAYGWPTTAFNLLAQRTGRALQCVLAGETGAANSLTPLTVAATKGIPVVDADGGRRALPQLAMATYNTNGSIPISPLVFTGPSSSTGLEVETAAEADASIRGIISTPAFDNQASAALWTLDSSQLNNATVYYSMSYAMNLGATLRGALANGQDPVTAVIQYLTGYELFRGAVQAVNEQTSGGFDIGTVVLEDTSGTLFTIYNQNENLYAFRSDRDTPVCLAPDLICYLTPTGGVLSNAEIDNYIGQELVIIGAPSNSRLRTSSSLTVFGQALRSIGYGGQYIPLEQLQSQGNATPMTKQPENEQAQRRTRKDG